MPETFLPTHTVFYSTNHKPRIGSGDYGTWRRIKNLPFEYKFSDAEKKTNFAEQVIAEESEGILNWIFEGAAKFIENGCKLTTPQFVLDATEEYKENEDIVGQFIAEKCVMGDYTKDKKIWKVGSQELYIAYKEYCKDSGAYTKSISDFNNSMSSVDGVVKVNASGKKFWTGLRLKREYEDVPSHSVVGAF
jgi:putative DNA primase/helicase